MFMFVYIYQYWSALSPLLSLCCILYNNPIDRVYIFFLLLFLLQLKQEREEEEERQKREEEEERKKKRKKKEGDKGPTVYRQGIGKYINAAAT